MTIEATYLFGDLRLEPVRYRICEYERRAWFRSRKEFFIECEYSKFGPFDKLADAQETLSLLNRPEAGGIVPVPGVQGRG